MNEDLMYKTITLAVQTAINIYEERKQDLIKKQKEQNIKKIKCILKNYRVIKECLDLNRNLPNNLKKEAEENHVDLSNNINEIMNHFDKILIILKSVYEIMGQIEDLRCYRIIEDLYLIEQSAEKPIFLQGEDKISMIAAKYNINKRTVYKDINKICNIISLLFFGIMD